MSPDEGSDLALSLVAIFSAASGATCSLAVIAAISLLYGMSLLLSRMLTPRKRER